MSYPAAFYGPSSTSARPATVRLAGDRFLIELDGEPLVWPRATLRFEDSAVAGCPLRLSSTASPGLLVVSDPELLALFGYRRKGPSTALWQGLAILAAVSLGLLAAGYFVFLPWIAGVLARRVPPSLEQQLGRAALEQLAPASARCDEESVRKPVRAIVDKLARDAPGMGYAFQVYVVKDKMVNAMAAPGGYIIVYTGLLEKTESPEGLAAVLAHEMTHVTGRHGMTGILRAMTFWIMLSYLVGDTSGILVQSAGALSQLSYQRGQEEEADRGAMRLFEAARIDPRGLEQSFAMLSKETPEIPASARYFSTHPRTADRLTAIRKWKDAVRYRPRPLIDDASWPPRGCGI